jgi:hypothetical protein
VRRYAIEDGELIRAESKDVLERRRDGGPPSGHEWCEMLVEGPALPQDPGCKFMRQPSIVVGELGESCLAGHFEIAALPDLIQHPERGSSRGKTG